MAEKRLSEIARPVREQYEKGMAAYHRQNWDYAIAILGQVLQQEPGFYDARAALRAAQFKKAGDGGGFLKKFIGSASSSPLLAKAQIAQRSNPLEAISTCEQILGNDPQNSGAHKLLADAALAAGFPKTAVLSLEIVFKNHPKDRGLALRLGEVLGQMGEIDKAEKIYQDLLATNPNDSEVAQAYKNLSAHRTLTEGGYDALSSGTGSYRDILKDKGSAVAMEQEQRQVKTDDTRESVIAHLEARLAGEPENLGLLRKIADLYAEQKDYDRALKYYGVLAASELGKDPTLERMIAELTIKQSKHSHAQLDPNTPNYAEHSARVDAEQTAFRLAECKKRAEKYPTDLQVRFELGQLYWQAGQITEAIQEFQKAQANPHLRSQSLYYLGQCFAQRNMFDLAARTLENAIKEKLVFDDEKKDLIYALGIVQEKMGHETEAIEQFKQIYEVDIGYKDVAAKVDAFYARKHQP